MVQRIAKKSRVTAKYQVTIPREVRELLKLHVADAIEWKSAEDGRIYVAPVEQPFLKLMGSIKTGPGDPVEDVKKARENRGRRPQ